MISINNLTVAYGGFTLLNEINFHISESDKIGLVGKNGAGKSTILKLICGFQSPTSGKVAVPNGVKIGYLPQIMEHHKGRSVIDEAMTAFAAGDRVSHAVFGTGEVLSVRPMGTDILYEVVFEKVGTKKLMGTYAKLKKED